ncbi:hypothetical protein JMA_30990 [Jeotgalibacillus malaysiensis]|uniref:Uncharacterized protein n=1 Tax=Jeotgalibacillus malaysiensis TaxID=1508404 RepID=A0A0B5AQQ2_9BACL|nr:hypothetical protein JMA_30990 [Jeotgalibacillus malaysiensis]
MDTTGKKKAESENADGGCDPKSGECDPKNIGCDLKIGGPDPKMEILKKRDLKIFEGVPRFSEGDRKIIDRDPKTSDPAYTIKQPISYFQNQKKRKTTHGLSLTHYRPKTLSFRFTTRS